MLCLSRKLREAIVIDGGIRIVVTEIRGNKVFLGVEAPRAIGVWREEIIDPEARARVAANRALAADEAEIARRAFRHQFAVA